MTVHFNALELGSWEFLMTMEDGLDPFSHL